MGANGGLPLSASLSCTRCGYQNQPGYQFCSNCGAPLGPAPGA
ncbi:MAG TPA: zinc ribbon domain-containing protein, partial [Thermoplasmata archaeon]|nr:zinc ribbon domain-containing protein [Thermoplasmata archaeon]